MLPDAQAFAEARNRMVDSQVRPNKVTDPRIVARDAPPAARALRAARAWRRSPTPTRMCRSAAGGCCWSRW